MLVKESCDGAAMYVFLLSLLSISSAAPTSSVSVVALGSTNIMGSAAIMALRNTPSADSERSLSSDAIQDILNMVFPALQGGSLGLLAADINQQIPQRLGEVSVSSLTDINGTLALGKRHNLPVLVVYTREELQNAARGRSLNSAAALQRLNSPAQRSRSNNKDDSDENNETDTFEPLALSDFRRGSQQKSLNPLDTGGRGRPSPTYSGICIRCGGPAF